MATVTLHDGRQVDSYSEDWRHECEARTILTWPLAKRRDYLHGFKDEGGRVHKGVEQTRGREEMNRLERTVLALWTATQVAKLAKMDEDERAYHLGRIEKATNTRMRGVVEVALGRHLAANDNNESDYESKTNQVGL